MQLFCNIGVIYFIFKGYDVKYTSNGLLFVRIYTIKISMVGIDLADSNDEIFKFTPFFQASINN